MWTPCATKNPQKSPQVGRFTVGFLDVSKNRGIFPPILVGENNGKPYEQMGWFGGAIIFENTQIVITILVADPGPLTFMTYMLFGCVWQDPKWCDKSLIIIEPFNINKLNHKGMMKRFGYLTPRSSEHKGTRKGCLLKWNHVRWICNIFPRIILI